MRAPGAIQGARQLHGKTYTPTPSMPCAADKDRLQENSTSTCPESIATQSHAQNTRINWQTTLRGQKSHLEVQTQSQEMMPTAQITTALTLGSAPVRNRG
jgi:hypothetical protein